MLPADTHVHTALCRHADGRPIDYARDAFRRGLPELTFTDHAPAPDGYDPGSRMDAADFPAYLEDVAEAARAFPGRVALGVEADYYPGCEAYLPRFLDATPFDLVLGSVHFIGDWGFDNPAYVERWRTSDVREVWGHYFGLVRQMVQTGWFDALSHFDLPKKFGHRIPEADVRDLVLPVLDAVAEAGMAIELNTGGLRKPVKEIYPTLAILEWMRERRIPILFGSDAHAPSEAGFGFDEAVRVARSAGYTAYARFRGRAAAGAAGAVPLTDG